MQLVFLFFYSATYYNNKIFPGYANWAMQYSLYHFTVKVHIIIQNSLWHTKVLLEAKTLIQAVSSLYNIRTVKAEQDTGTQSQGISICTSSCPLQESSTLQFHYKAAPKDQQRKQYREVDAQEIFWQWKTYRQVLCWNFSWETFHNRCWFIFGLQLSLIDARTK